MTEQNAERVAEYLGVPFWVLQQTSQRARKTEGVSTLDLIARGAETGNSAEYLKVGEDIYEPVTWGKCRYSDDGVGVEKRVPVAYAKRGELVVNPEM